MKTKTNLSIFLIFLVTLVSCSCTESSDEKEDTNTAFINLAKSVSYQGVSFDYPDNWKVEKKMLLENVIYQINCVKNGNETAGFISIISMNVQFELRELMQLAIKSMKTPLSHKNANVKPFYNIVYNSSNALRTDYDVELSGIKVYGQITTFNSNNKSFTVLKQTDSISKLDSEFKVVESSLIIK